MRVGYGRGYYGNGQLAPSAPKRRTSWFKIVAVLGVGAAAVWFLWPRNKPLDPSLMGAGKAPEALPPATSASPSALTATAAAVPVPVAAPATPVVAMTPVATNMTSLPAVGSTSASSNNRPAATGAFLKQVEDDARARGFVSASDYEDSVIATAKQLQATGAQVVLAPHLQHLAPLLAS